MAIYFDYVVTIDGNKAKMDKDIHLYKGNKNIDYYFTIKDAAFKFSKTESGNIIEKLAPSHAAVTLLKPNGVQVSTGKAVVEGNKLKLTITQDMIDEDTEIGDHTIVFDLLDDERDSIATLPPVEKQFHVYERKTELDIGQITATNVVDEATVGYAMTTSDVESLDVVDAQGNYIKTVWVTGDKITKEKLNKLEEGVYKNSTSKFDDAEVSGSNLLLKVNGTTKKTVTLPSSGSTVEGHTHDNKSTLDKVTEEKLNSWDNKADISHTHSQYLTEHQDISGLQSKTDPTLTTTNKTIPSAINELDAQCKEIEDEMIGTIKKQDDIFGGVIPQPFRVPTLNIYESYPTNNCPYIPCWIENNGKTIYAYGKDNTLRKSVNGGNSYTKLGYNAYGFGMFDCFIKCKDGSLINIAYSSPYVIQRSVDDGVTWSVVHTLRSGILALGSQSLCLDENTGYLYFGEYNTIGSDKIGVIVSKDNGATWQDFYMWNGKNTPIGTENRIYHIHSVQYDEIEKRVYICTGDSTDSTGIYRITNDNSSVEKVITNDMIDIKDIDTPRAIGLMFFNDYILWGSDSPLNPYLMRLKRSEIGKDRPFYEKLYRLNSSAWFTCRVSNTSDTWIMSVSQESNSIDNATHLLAIKNNGDICWELGSIATDSDSFASSLQPVGFPYQNESFWMVTRDFKSKQVWNFKISNGFINIQKPTLNDDVLLKQSFNGSNMTIPPNTEIVFGTTISSINARTLNIFECNVGEIGTNSGILKIIIRKRSDNSVIYETDYFSDRYNKRVDLGNEYFKTTLNSNEKIDFIIKNVHQGNSCISCPSVIFGWSNWR